jgi:predicted dehydrogenase
MVGTGLMLRLIGHDFRLTDNVDLQVIVSRTRARADASAAEYGVPEGSDDFEAVLRRDDIDVIYVATPHPLHFPMAKAALEAGKHVLVEKPMTMNAADTRELSAIATREGRFLMEAMWTAFNPAIIELRRRVAEGAIGEPALVEANFCTAPPFDPESRIFAKDLGGGSVLDQGVYTLSLAHMLFGKPTRVVAVGVAEHEIDLEATVLLEFPGNKRAVCASSLRGLSPLSAFVTGSTGGIDIPGAFWNASGFKQFVADGGSTAVVDEFTYEREGSGYVPMLRAAGQAILDGKLQHELRTHAESIAVAETMDEVLRQVLAG